MSGSRHSRHFDDIRAMSAFPPIATEPSLRDHLRALWSTKDGGSNWEHRRASEHL